MLSSQLLKQQLTCNVQLAHLGWAYGLHDSLARRDNDPALDTLSIKMVADAFEAYLGILYREATAGGRAHEVEAFVRELHSVSVYPTLADYASSLDDYWTRFLTGAAGSMSESCASLPSSSRTAHSR